jgi:hypothetical protein
MSINLFALSNVFFSN